MQEACHDYDGSQYLKALKGVSLTTTSISIAPSTGCKIAAILVVGLFALHI